jgi:ketosteroid isomerase-like protein
VGYGQVEEKLIVRSKVEEKAVRFGRPFLLYNRGIMKLLFCLSLILFTTVAAAAQKPEAAIRKVMDDQVVAWNKGDIEGFMAGYWKSDKLVFVGSSGVTRGWQQTLDNYKKNYSSRQKMGTLTFSDLEINVISKDAATVLGKWSLAREKDNPKGTFTLLFRKLKEGWRIVMDHSS